jgi:hypothetical protein
MAVGAGHKAQPSLGDRALPRELPRFGALPIVASGDSADTSAPVKPVDAVESRPAIAKVGTPRPDGSIQALEEYYGASYGKVGEQ